MAKLNVTECKWSTDKDSMDDQLQDTVSFSFSRLVLLSAFQV